MKCECNQCRYAQGPKQEHGMSALQGFQGLLLTITYVCMRPEHCEHLQIFHSCTCKVVQGHASTHAICPKDQISHLLGQGMEGAGCIRELRASLYIRQLKRDGRLGQQAHGGSRQASFGDQHLPGCHLHARTEKKQLHLSVSALI